MRRVKFCWCCLRPQLYCELGEDGRLPWAANIRLKIDPIPGMGAALLDAWRLAFFGGTVGSGAMMLVLSAASPGAASTTFGGSVDDAALSAVGAGVDEPPALASIVAAAEVT